jgi:GcrA cell cycle regulator
MSFWNDQSLARLKELAGQGLSAGRIASLLASEFHEPVSRNAVIGKLIRGKGRYGRLQQKAPWRSQRPEAEAATAARRLCAAPPEPQGAKRPMRGARQNAPSPSPSRLPAVPAVGSTPLPHIREGEERFALPAPLPIGFFEAVERGRCLHFVGDPMGPGGPDMPVCGAERAHDAPFANRYCARHRASAAGLGTIWERGAERTLVREARHG